MRAHEKGEGEWFCPRCLEWFGFKEDCSCAKREPSRIHRTKDRGLYVARDTRKGKS